VGIGIIRGGVAFIEEVVETMVFLLLYCTGGGVRVTLDSVFVFCCFDSVWHL
jgi:hypothetical protein